MRATPTTPRATSHGHTVARARGVEIHRPSGPPFPGLGGQRGQFGLGQPREVGFVRRRPDREVEHLLAPGGPDKVEAGPIRLRELHDPPPSPADERGLTGRSVRGRHDRPGPLVGLIDDGRDPLADGDVAGWMDGRAKVDDQLLHQRHVGGPQREVAPVGVARTAH